MRFLPGKFSGNFQPLFARDFVQIVQLDKLQGFAGADFHANGIFHVGAPVALEGEFPFRPGENDSERTIEGAGPAGDAAVFANHNRIAFRIPNQGCVEAGIEAGGLEALAALQRKGALIVSFHPQAGLGQRGLPDSLKKVFLAAAPLGCAVELAAATSRAAVKVDSDDFHG